MDIQLNAQAAKAAAAQFVLENRLAFMAQAARERHNKRLLVYTKTSCQVMYSNGQIPPTNITFIPVMPSLFQLKQATIFDTPEFGNALPAHEPTLEDKCEEFA